MKEIFRDKWQFRFLWTRYHLCYPIDTIKVLIPTKGKDKDECV